MSRNKGQLIKCPLCNQEKGLRDGHDNICCECGRSHWACEPCWGAAVATGHVRVRSGWWETCPKNFVIPPAPVSGAQATVKPTSGT